MLLVPTVLQDAIIAVSNDKTFMDYEARISRYSVFKLFQDGANTLLPKSVVENIKKSYRQPEKVAVLNQINTTFHNSYTCNISPDGSTSAFVPVTYITTGFDVGVTPATNADNYISVEEDLAWQIKQGFKNIYQNVLEPDAVAYLEANKSLTNDSPASLFPGATFAAGVYTISDAAKNRFYANIPAIFQRNDFPGKPADVANTEAIPDELYIANQGAQNGQNLAYQVQGYDFYRSNRVSVANGMEQTHYLLPQGAVGFYNWLPWEGRNKQKINEGEGWTTQVDPILGMEWQVYWKYACVNGQYTIAMSYTASFAFMKQYSSDPNRSSILKYQIALPA